MPAASVTQRGISAMLLLKRVGYLSVDVVVAEIPLCWLIHSQVATRAFFYCNA